jgi:hypothetical protein
MLEFVVGMGALLDDCRVSHEFPHAVLHGRQVSRLLENNIIDSSLLLQQRLGRPLQVVVGGFEIGKQIRKRCLKYSARVMKLRGSPSGSEHNRRVRARQAVVQPVLFRYGGHTGKIRRSRGAFTADSNRIARTKTDRGQQNKAAQANAAGRRKPKPRGRRG